MVKHTREYEIYRVTIIGGIVNLLLLIFKFVAGILGHSAAMIADAVHSFSDFVSDIIVIAFVRISSKPADCTHKYGHGKFETLASAIIGCVLFVVAIGIGVSGIKNILKVFHGEVLPAPSTVAFIAAVVSIVAKEVLYQYTVFKGRRLCSQVVVANAWHHRSDSLSSIGALLGIGGAMFGGEKWRVLDPVAAVVVSIFILQVAISIIKNSLDELLEHSLPEDVEQEIEQIILSVEGVSSPHHLRTRRIGSHYAIEAHIRMDGSLSLYNAHQTTSIVEKLIKQRFGENTIVTIHTEPVK